MKSLSKPHSLFAYISFHLVILCVLTVLAIAVPSVYILQMLMENRLWAQIEQGSRTSTALLKVQELELTEHAKLVAERPTLLELLQLNDLPALTNYLTILQEGIQSDSITICDQDGRVLVSTLKLDDILFCPYQNYLRVIQNPTDEAWLFRTHPITLNETQIGTAIVGKQLSDEFAASMRAETGLDYLLLSNGNLVASSLEITPSEWQYVELIETSQNDNPAYTALHFSKSQDPFYAISIPLAEGGPQSLIAMPVGQALKDLDEQILLMLAGISGILCVALLFSSVIARRISKPLEELSAQAVRIKLESIPTPIKTGTMIKEMIVMADAFEGARLDLTEKVIQLQQEQDWNRHLLEAIAEGILTLDEENRILYFSPAAERITGWTKDEVVQRFVDDFFKLVDNDTLFSENLPSPGEKYFLHVELAKGKKATLSISGAEFLPGEAGDTQIALVFRDVTEEVAINRLLGQFLSNVAHEFRTPLSALAASVELLEDQFPDFNSNEVMELIRSQKLGVLGLETLIDNLLESSSIEARRFRVTPRTFDLDGIISDVEQTLSPLLEKHGQKLVVKMPEELPLVYGDPRRTVQVLINLLSNAIKYGPENSEIVLNAIERDRKVRVSISDHGPGISPEYREEIFTRFNIPRTENERAKPGAGLGLSVVKAIVEAQGGEVGVDDNPGSGASFWFTLRLAKSK